MSANYRNLDNLEKNRIKNLPIDLPQKIMLVIIAIFLLFVPLIFIFVISGLLWLVCHNFQASHFSVISDISC